MKPVWIVCAGLLVTAPAAAQPVPPNPCESNLVFDQFDFWVGDWNVYQGDGALAGVNRISKTDQGCLVRENWRAVSGSTGFSMNYYDVGAAAWRQIWVSSGAQIDFAGGLDEAGVMRLDGVIHYPATGASAPFRGAWTRLEQGGVLQEFHQQNIETGSWDVWFVGRYVPAGSEPDNAAASALWAEMN